MDELVADGSLQQQQQQQHSASLLASLSSDRDDVDIALVCELS